jgi:hypothetical protein
VGYNEDYVELNCGRIETFEIAADEQLIGAEVCHGDFNNNGVVFIIGVNWMKCKIFK